MKTAAALALALAAAADAFAPAVLGVRRLTSLNSHFSTIETKIFNKATLLKALEDIGVQARTSAAVGGQLEARGHKGEVVMADVVVPQGNGYDVAFRHNGETYELVADLEFWQQTVPVDAFMEKVHQRYAVNSVMETSKGEGFNVDKVKTAVDGTVTLTMSRYAMAGAPSCN